MIIIFLKLYIWNCNFLLHKSCTEQPYTEEMEIFDPTQHKRHHLMFIEEPDKTNAYSFSSLSRSSTNIRRFLQIMFDFKHPPSVALVLDLRRWKFWFLVQRASTQHHRPPVLRPFVEDRSERRGSIYIMHSVIYKHYLKITCLEVVRASCFGVHEESKTLDARKAHYSPL